eukprot:6212850-Pleurochrysis_carterae.AAC.5
MEKYSILYMYLCSANNYPSCARLPGLEVLLRDSPTARRSRQVVAAAYAQRRHALMFYGIERDDTPCATAG